MNPIKLDLGPTLHLKNNMREELSKSMYVIKIIVMFPNQGGIATNLTSPTSTYTKQVNVMLNFELNQPLVTNYSESWVPDD